MSGGRGGRAQRPSSLLSRSSESEGSGSGQPAGFGPGIDPTGSVLRRYPAGSDVEVILALRHLLEEAGRRPEELDDRANLPRGTVSSLTSGYVEPPGPLLRRLCRELRIPRWLFYLTGAIVFGAELGHRDLEKLVEKRRRQLAGNPDQITDTDLAVEAVEILLGLGEDLWGSQDSPSGSRRALAGGVKRLARRADRRGEHGSAGFLDSVAAIVLRGVEALSDTELEPVVDVLDLARSLESGPGLDCNDGEVPR